MAEAAAPRAATLCVTVAVSLKAGEAEEWSLQLPAGTALGDALVASVALGRLQGADTFEADCGIWGQRAPPDRLLHDGDRVELYRPLTVDPKVARRERFARQGARTAGLFARERNPTKKTGPGNEEKMP